MGVDFEIDDWCIYCILVLRFGNIFCRTAMLYLFFSMAKKNDFYLFMRHLHNMVQHTQTTSRQQPTNCLSVLDHFVGLALQGLKLSSAVPSSLSYWILLSCLATVQNRGKDTNWRCCCVLRGWFCCLGGEFASGGGRGGGGGGGLALGRNYDPVQVTPNFKDFFNYYKYIFSLVYLFRLILQKLTLCYFLS